MICSDQKILLINSKKMITMNRRRRKRLKIKHRLTSHAKIVMIIGHRTRFKTVITMMTTKMLIKTNKMMKNMIILIIILVKIMRIRISSISSSSNNNNRRKNDLKIKV